MSDASPDLDAEQFFSRVKAWTSAAYQEGIRGFPELLRKLPGVYPSTVLAAVDRLIAEGQLPKTFGDRLRLDSRTAANERMVSSSLLPPPHPLNFEWRFTFQTSRELLDCARRLGSSTLLLGTPGVALEAVSQVVLHPVRFVGEDNIVTRRILALNDATGTPISVDFCGDDLPHQVADVVIVDPPWYPDFVRPMLASAMEACREGGYVLLSIAPDGARSSATDDRLKTIAFAKRLGLRLVEERRLAVEYDTPLFERNALAASGLACPLQWRRGDLLVLHKVDASSVRQVRHSTVSPWQEVSVGRMRVFIRRGGPATGTRGLVPLVSGDILPTVSRSDPRREAAQVWTSGNRIFATDNVELVVEAAAAYHAEARGERLQGSLWDSTARRHAVDRVQKRLAELAALEASEEIGYSAEKVFGTVPPMRVLNM